MAKMAEMSPCPCGSGKSINDVTELLIKWRRRRIRIRPARMSVSSKARGGLSGYRDVHDAEAYVREKSNDPRNQAPPSGSPGKYKVVL